MVDAVPHRKKANRNWALRLAFAFLVFLYAGLNIFTGSKSVTRTIDMEAQPFGKNHRLGLLSSKQLNSKEGNTSQTKKDPPVTLLPPLATKNEVKRTRRNDFAPSQRALHRDGGDIYQGQKNETLDGSTLSMQATLKAMEKLKKKKGTQGEKKKTKHLSPEIQLQKSLNLTFDSSEFQPEKLHKSLLSFYSNESAWGVTIDHDPHIWDQTTQTKLPEWMKRYLRWHNHMRLRLVDPAAAGNSTGREEPLKFLVMQCLSSDHHCGGVSDRLKTLPLLLRIAYYTKRVLLIYWSRPGPLEDFLVPPRGGIDWRVPPWMLPQIKDYVRHGVFTYEYLRKWTPTDVTLVTSRLQDYHGGRYYYDEQLVEGEVDFAGVFHDLWRIFFTPSPPVRAILESDMQRLGLVPGQYVAAHLRALYGIKDRSDTITRNWARNAMNCASELRPQTTVLFVSDSMSATSYAREYASERNATLITRLPNPNPPFHMDKVRDWQRRNISDFYDSFIDIYIMGQADCLTYNKGGYGLLGLFLSRNSTCGVRQDALDRPKIHNPCIWVDDPLNGTRVTRDSLPQNPIVSNASIYLEPMD